MKRALSNSKFVPYLKAKISLGWSVVEFLGKKTFLYLIAGCALGLALFFVELFFALALQKALSAANILPDSDIGPAWAKKISGLEISLIFLVVVGLGRTVLNFFQSYVQSITAVELTVLFKRRTFFMLFQTGRETLENIMERNQQANHAGVFISNVQGAMFNFILLVALGASLLKIMPVPTLLIGVVLALVLYPLKSMDMRVSEFGRVNTKENGKVDTVLFRSIKNLLFLKIYNTESIELNRALQHLEHGAQAHSKIGLFCALRFAFPQGVGVIVLALIVFSFGSPALGFNGSPAKNITYLYVFIRAIQTLAQLQSNLSWTSTYTVPIRNYYNWWVKAGHDRPDLLQESTLLVEPQKNPIESVGWTFENVSFRYSITSPLVLNNLNLCIKPNTCLAILGPSGVGKSTLLSLLIGLNSPTAGRGLLEVEQNSSQASFPLSDAQKVLYGSIGYVGPESFMIEGTIEDNLLYGTQNSFFTSEFLNETLALAECGFVHDLKEGLQHRMTEQGEGLSAGQKQRLGLARALLRRPKVLILDEATSNLDPKTEANILCTLEKLKESMTIVAVTHRESILKIADQHIQMSAHS